MEKIEILLEKLDNRITSSLAKRLDDLDNLNEKLDLAGQEYEKNPTDENRTKYNEVIDFAEAKELGIINDLEKLLEKRKAEELAKEQKANEPVTPVAPVTPTPETPAVKSEEKKESFGVLTLVIGGALLVASFGAINYFRKQ
jgi:hypothetical protein